IKAYYNSSFTVFSAYLRRPFFKVNVCNLIQGYLIAITDRYIKISNVLYRGSVQRIQLYNEIKPSFVLKNNAGNTSGKSRSDYFIDILHIQSVTGQNISVVFNRYLRQTYRSLYLRRGDTFDVFYFV